MTFKFFIQSADFPRELLSLLWSGIFRPQSLKNGTELLELSDVITRVKLKRTTQDPTVVYCCSFDDAVWAYMMQLVIYLVKWPMTAHELFTWLQEKIC